PGEDAVTVRDGSDPASSRVTVDAVALGPTTRATYAEPPPSRKNVSIASNRGEPGSRGPKVRSNWVRLVTRTGTLAGPRSAIPTANHWPISVGAEAGVARSASRTITPGRINPPRGRAWRDAAPSRAMPRGVAVAVDRGGRPRAPRR